MNKKILIKTIVAGFAKSAAALIAFCMTVLVARLAGIEESGLFFLAISILAFLSSFFRLGLDSVFLRLIGADGGTSKSIGAVTTGLCWSLMSSIVFTVIIYFNSEFLAVSVFSKSKFQNVIEIMVWALPFMVVFMLLSFGFQAFYKVVWATIFQNLGVSSLFLILIIFADFHDLELSATAMSMCYLVAGVLTCILSLFLWLKHVRIEWVFAGKLKNLELWRSSSNLWAANTMSLVVQWSGMLIAGLFVTSSEIALFSAAQRTALLISFVLIVANMVVAPRYARLWQEGKLNDIQYLSKVSTRAMIALAMLPLAAMVFVPQFIMGLFGDEFAKAENLLVIMAIGQFVNVATGSVGYLLNMSGHEKDFRRVTFFAGPLTIILSFWLILDYGVLGAAIATAIGLSLQNIGALFMVRKRLGFWPIG